MSYGLEEMQTNTPVGLGLDGPDGFDEVMGGSST